MRSIILCSYPQDQQRGKDGRQEGAMAQTKSQEEKEGRPSQALTCAEGPRQGLCQEGGPPISYPRRQHARGEKVEEAQERKRIMKRPEPTAPASSESSLEKHA